MDNLPNEVFTFFQSQIVWIITFVGGLVSGIKYLDHKQTDKIKNEVKSEISPYIQDLCKQLLDLKHNFELARQKNDLVIESLDRAIMHFQALEEGKEVRDYRLRNNSVDNYG